MGDLIIKFIQCGTEYGTEYHLHSDHKRSLVPASYTSMTLEEIIGLQV